MMMHHDLARELEKNKITMKVEMVGWARESHVRDR